MSHSSNFEDDAERRYTKPLSGKHPIPTVQNYRHDRKELQAQLDRTEEEQQGPEDESKPRRAYDSAKAVLRGEDQQESHHDPYPSANHHYAEQASKQQQEQLPGSGEGQEQEFQDSKTPSGPDGKDQGQDQEEQKDKKPGKQDKSGTEAVAGATDAKEKRKAMKKSKRHGGGREVTDPITHLPVIIHDQTDKDLHSVPENEAEPGTNHDTATGPQAASKSDDELEEERKKIQGGHNGMHAVFLAFATGISLGISQWTGKKTDAIFQDQVWDASRREEQSTLDADTELPESVQWLNSFFASVWPLINPDLFSSLSDMIEDVMQASLPKVIKMVSVDDMGQGNEAPRILGIRWLPTGAAGQTVGPDGKLQKPDQEKSSDRTDPQNAQEDDAEDENDGGDEEKKQDNSNQKKQNEQEETSVREGLEAEEGDFVNLELALAYRSRSSGKSIKEKAKNAHLYLKFYLPGGVAVPVWVELRGIVLIMRMRLQLTVGVSSQAFVLCISLTSISPTRRL